MIQVSVVLPVFNASMYLKECIDSLITQTLKNIEIICVDDGSSDDSLKILQDYACLDKRIRVISQENAGAANARNKGIDSAKGQYLYFLDADDYMDKTALEKLYKKITETSADVCFCRHNLYDMDSQKTLEFDYSVNKKLLPKSFEFSRTDLPQNILQICVPNVFIKLYKRDFILLNNIRFQEIKICNDVCFNHLSLILAQKIAYVDEVLVTYRINSKTNLSSQRGVNCNCVIEAFSHLKKELEERGLFKCMERSFYLAAKTSFSYELGFCDKEQTVFLQKRINKFLPIQYQLSRIFSLKNKDNHKVLTILGVKFKFRRKPKNVNEYDLCKNMPEEKYPQYLKEWFVRVTGKILNLENPQTFNEKIQWLKLYDSTPLKTKLADKYLVREYVKEKIGEEYLIPLLGVWQNPDDINFDELPEKFVLKTNHGSGWNIIVKDKSKINVEQAKSQLNEWLHTNYAFCCGLELHYKNIKPLIIAEEYIETNNNDLEDFKFLCFNGQVKYIWVDKNRYTEHKRNIYNIDWILSDKQISENHVYENFANCPKPFNLNKMIEFAKILSKGFSFVRVDFYENNKKMYFGELTFTSASGTHIFTPESFNNELGNLVDLKSIKEGKNSEQHTNNTCGR